MRALPLRSLPRATGLLVALAVAGCSPRTPPRLPPPSASAAAAPAFVEVARAAGVDFVHWNGRTGRMFYSEVIGGGVALFDADGDADLDLFFTQGGLLDPRERESDAVVPPPEPSPRGRLFRNDSPPGEPLRFADATAGSGIAARGYGMGAATADVDDDGDVDLLLTYLGKVELWRNRGDGTFVEDAVRSGLAETLWATAASFFDADRDGDLDLYLVRYLDFDAGKHAPCLDPSSAPVYCGPATYRPLTDRFFRNRGDGTFEERSRQAGIAERPGPGLGSVVLDADDDGWLDVYVANDGAANFLWRNRGDGSFEEVAELAGCAYSIAGLAQAGMGVDAADVDVDGDEDLVVTNLEGETNTLYLNGSDGLFVDGTAGAGLAAPSLPFTSFGVGFFDADLDGRLELAVVSGAIRPLPALLALGDPFPLHQRNQLFRPTAPGRYRDTSAAEGPAFVLSEVSRGLGLGDLDGDGAADLVIANNGGPARLLHNRTPAAARGHFLGARLLTGAPGRDALGALAALPRPGARPLIRRVATDGSYLSARDPRLLFGLGADAGPQELRVRWPDGRTERFAALAADRYHLLRQGAGEPIEARQADATGASGAAPAALAGTMPWAPDSGALQALPDSGALGPLPDSGALGPPPDSGALGPPPAPGTLGAELEPVGEPPLASLEPRVRERLAARRAELRAVVLAPAGETAAAARAAAWGELGELDHAYGFLETALAAYRNARRLAPAEPRWAYLAGQAATEAGRIEESLAHFTAARDLRPDEAPPRVRRAQSLRLLGREVEARAELEAVLARDPDVAFAEVLLAELARERGEPAEAVTRYRRALALQPGASALRGQLAVALRAAGRDAEAEAEASRRGAGRPTFADPWLVEVEALRASSQVERERGQAALDAGRPQEAERHFRAALVDRPADDALWVQLGVALSAQGRLADARAAFERAHVLRPDNPTALFDLGTLAARLGDDAGAIARFEAALALDPRLPEVRLNLANALRREGRRAEALEQYRALAELLPGRGAELGGGRLEALLGEIFCLAELDRTVEALAAAEAARARFSDSRPLAGALARLLATAPAGAGRDGERALDLARQAAGEAPSLAGAETLAMAAAAAGSWDEARRWQEQALAAARRAGRSELEPPLLDNLERYRRELPAERPWPRR